MENRMFIASTIFTLVAIYTDRASCEYYTSVSGMDALLEADGHLLDFMKDFIKEGNQTLDRGLLEVVGHIEDEYEEAKNDSFAYLSNPISAFKLIKRFVVDWVQIAEHIKADADLAFYLTTVMNDGFQFPTEADLMGAAQGLARLQAIYVLSVTDLAEGKIHGTKYGLPMSAEDCMELGLMLFKAGEYILSLPWLQEAQTKFKKVSTPPRKTTLELLRYLTATYVHLGNSKLASITINEILQLDAVNRDANGNSYETNMFKKRNTWADLVDPFKIQKEPTLEELSAMTCRGERHQTPSEQRTLRCMYTANGIPYRLIGPFRMEQLNLHPPITYYYEVISDREIEYVIKKVKPTIKRSELAGESPDSVTVSNYRISKTGWLFPTEVDFLNKLFSRLEDMAGLSIKSADPLQIVNYGIGGHYAHHYDFENDPREDGNRIATALFHLKDIELGGQTAFPHLKLAVSPVKGGMLLWHNLHVSLEPDYRTRHTACPVLKGSKWILTNWFREKGQEFLRPCSMDQQGEVSMKYAYEYV